MSERKNPAASLLKQSFGFFAAARSGGYCHPDMESIMIDGTIVRTHACAAGAPQKSLINPQDKALGRSKGGFTTKIHIMGDALGNPLNFILTGGQAGDVNQAYTLIEWEYTLNMH